MDFEEYRRIEAGFDRIAHRKILRSRFWKAKREVLPKDFRKIKPDRAMRYGELSHIFVLYHRRRYHDRDRIEPGWAFDQLLPHVTDTYSGHLSMTLHNQMDDEEAALQEMKDVLSEGLEKLETEYGSRRQIYEMEARGEGRATDLFACAIPRAQLIKGRLAKEFGDLEKAKECLKFVANYDTKGICWQEDLKSAALQDLKDLQ